MDELILYSGMTYRQLAEFLDNPTLRPLGFNYLTKDFNIARIYSRENEDEEGAVVKFIIPMDYVEEDEIYKGDYKVVKEYSVTDFKVVDWGNFEEYKKDRP